MTFALIALVGVLLLAFFLLPELPTQEIEAQEIDARPSNNEGSFVAVCFGEVITPYPVVVDVRDTGSTAIKKKVSSGGLLGGSKKQTVGYKYSAAVHWLFADSSNLSRVRAIVFGEDIQVANELVGAWSGSGSYEINKPKLFGEQQGGIEAHYVMNFGDLTAYGESGSVYEDVRTHNGLLALHQSGKSVRTDVEVNGSFGAVTFSKPSTFGRSNIVPKVRLSGVFYSNWYTAKDAIGNQLNIVHAIHGILTTDLSPELTNLDKLDDAAWMAAADQAYDEQVAVSLSINKPETRGKAIEKLLFILQAVLVDNDGQVGIKLLRSTDAINKTLTDDDISSFEQLDTIAQDDLPNSITVEYTNPENHKTATVNQKDEHLIRQAGRIIEKKHSLPMIKDVNLAEKLAVRELKRSSQNLQGMRIQLAYCDFSLRVGDVVQVDSNRVTGRFRLSKNPTQNIGKDRIYTVLDLESDSGIDAGTVTPSAPVEPTSSVTEATDITTYRAITMPYYTALLEGGDVQGEYIQYFIAQNDDNLLYDSNFSDDSSFTSRAVTTQDIPVSQECTISYTGSIAGEIVLISDTLFKVVADDGENVTLSATADTVPAFISSGASIWSFDNYTFSDRIAVGETVDNEIKTQTVNDEQAEGVVISTTAQERFLLPYAPAYLQINGLDYPASVTGDITITWKHRTRSSSGLLAQADNDALPDGVQYQVIIQRDGAEVLNTQVNGTELIYSADADGAYFVSIAAVKNGQTSWQALTHSFSVTSATGDGSTTTGGEVTTDSNKTVVFRPQPKIDETHIYYGVEYSDGSWQIKKDPRGTDDPTIATGVGDFATAWANHLTQDYS